MAVIRAFIAIELSVEIRRSLDQVSSQLRHSLKGAPVRWVPADNIHLTLKFLGNVSVANLDLLKEVVRNDVARHSPFELSVGELGAFPSIHRPRVIVVRVQAPAELGQMQRGLEEQTRRLGYDPEERPFSPHLTLGRVSRNASTNEVAQLGKMLESARVGFLGAIQVSSVHLFRSDLQPSGAIYTSLLSAPLESG
jgi:2'-5' RNA ligase